MPLQLRILSPEKMLFEGQIDYINLPGSQGTFEVLTNHAALVSTLTEGVVCYGSFQQEKQEMPILNGLVEVRNNEVSLCVTTK